MNIKLFPEKTIIGSFKGYAESGHEFAADLVIPYRSEKIRQPQFGSFLLVRLSAADDAQEQATLGRITKVLPFGRLAGAEGEDYIERMRERSEKIPDEIKERMIQYRVRIKLLGVLRIVKGNLDFKPSQRRLPHLGAPVAWPSDKVLEGLCKLGGGETEIGHFALGEFIYDSESKKHADDNDADEKGVHLSPALPVTFNIDNLVAKRTAVFARAGYGKSNLMKYLVSELYKKEPKTENGRPVGMLIFDANGEYFSQDQKGNPGLCDVQRVKQKITVFSRRKKFDKNYEKWRKGDVKIDIRELEPHDVFSVALKPDQQEQQNVLKLKAIGKDNWKNLVNLVKKKGMRAGESDQFKKLLDSEASAVINAAIHNIHHVVDMLHDPGSKLLSETKNGLLKGNIVIIDLSMLNAKNGEVLTGLLMRNLFSYNQKNFIGDNSSAKDSDKPIPIIVVIEEAQRTLGGHLDETSPFVEWVKEGRKYDLGAVLVTQQPGALADELLSQVDNWFCFHVLSENDANILGKYNSHFSTDIRLHMIFEPIVGNCFMWSAPTQPFVLPVRVHEFKMYALTENFREAIRRVNKKKQLNKKSFKNELEGVKSGQLFRIIEEHLPLIQETKDRNNYKMPLMQGLLGKITVLEENGETVEISSGDKKNYYYCAPKKKWEKLFSDK